MRGDGTRAAGPSRDSCAVRDQRSVVARSGLGALIEQVFGSNSRSEANGAQEAESGGVGLPNKPTPMRLGDYDKRRTLL